MPGGSGGTGTAVCVRIDRALPSGLGPGAVGSPNSSEDRALFSPPKSHRSSTSTTTRTSTNSPNFGIWVKTAVFGLLCPESPVPLTRVALQECQGLLVELVDLLIHRGVRALFEYDEFRAADSTCQLIRKTSRRHHVPPPKGDLGWHLDLVQMRRTIVPDHGVRLLQEARHRLRRPAPHKVSQGLDVFRLSGIQLGRETPRENAQ